MFAVDGHYSCIMQCTKEIEELLVAEQEIMNAGGTASVTWQLNKNNLTQS